MLDVTTFPIDIVEYRACTGGIQCTKLMPFGNDPFGNNTLTDSTGAME